MKNENERVIVVGLNITNSRKKSKFDIEASMRELEELVQAAGGEVVGSIIQNKLSVDVAHYVGIGKAQEIRDYVEKFEVDLVVFNDELSGVQMRNLEETIGVSVVDRTALILDIFAQRALSREGKLQVELAQMKYRLPRLLGLGKQMSRTGAGIGTRGPGEKKLEIDRRTIAKRISDIRKELKEVQKNRDVQRAQRLKSQIPIVALVGYTNAGKSTLLNTLIKSHGEYTSEKEVFSKDMLFATLDVTLRKALLPCNKEFLITDTVGFVSNLPHDLVDAFKATLEEVKYADLILHVVDASNEDYDLQMDTTLHVLKELDCLDKDIITVFNKLDKTEYQVDVPGGEDVVFISCKTGYNMDALMDKIEEHLLGGLLQVELLIPYDRGDVFSSIQQKSQVESFEYKEEGIYAVVLLAPDERWKYEDYLYEK
ncbi:GTP-binding protein HflX [Peptoclostridium litorale DSM 5388]|uniref:GTPase HflX n=1 Tax=Peptoclostridium litorale DSM 5388 TaxID=1121324 RepID=A0A069RGH9_PEPLI|nr:GTPase HflX [Peptoclostridium litorale]KDR96119.1 GTPase HflX [Peptoclostridium litorale DSM 5388]SIO04232.1 GTP-binding protein HflX [Peptoclostridium litorale DSM 5388]